MLIHLTSLSLNLHLYYYSLLHTQSYILKVSKFYDIFSKVWFITIVYNDNSNNNKLMLDLCICYVMFKSLYVYLLLRIFIIELWRNNSKFLFFFHAFWNAHFITLTTDHLRTGPHNFAYFLLFPVSHSWKP